MKKTLMLLALLCSITALGCGPADPQAGDPQDEVVMSSPDSLASVAICPSAVGAYQRDTGRMMYWLYPAGDLSAFSKAMNACKAYPTTILPCSSWSCYRPIGSNCSCGK